MPERMDNNYNDYPDYPEYEGLSNRQIQFLLALQQFFRSWPDEKVAHEFEVTHKVAHEIAEKLKNDETFRFMLHVEGPDEQITKVPIVVRKAEDVGQSSGADPDCWWCFDESCNCFRLCGSC